MIAQASQNGNISFIVSLVLMVAIFYFLLIRPQQRRMRAQRELLSALDVGDEVITIGGIFGTIRRVDDDAFEVEISPGSTVRLLKSAVARRVVDEVVTEDDEEANDAS